MFRGRVQLGLHLTTFNFVLIIIVTVGVHHLARAIAPKELKDAVDGGQW